MTQIQSDRKKSNQICIILLSILGLMGCITVLFPQTRLLIMELAGNILHRKITYQGVFKLLHSLALGGIFSILFFDYCTLTDAGRLLVKKTKQEIKDCLSEVDYRTLLKPVLFMCGVYMCSVLTIIRANYLYRDDIWRSIEGVRGWHDWSRYVAEFVSIFIHGDTNLTDISPLPQLLAVLILSVSSVLLVYVTAYRKTTFIPLLASIPLGLVPYSLECLSFKFDAPYMALSILASIIPFLFVTRKKAFFVSSVIALLIMCMSYQAASGIYLLVVIILCFQDWNSRKKSNKEVMTFLGISALAFCFAMLFFRFFLMKPTTSDHVYIYASTTIHPMSQIISGTLINIKNYAITIHKDFGLIWKICIALVCVLFVIKSVHTTSRKKSISLFVSIWVIILSFILSYGMYSFLTKPMYNPRSLYGFGIWLAILCIFVVSDYKKIAAVPVIALNWCFLVFALSYGNALADQARYSDFRIHLLLQVLCSLYPDRSKEGLSIQLENSIEYAPAIKNISRNYPIIERLVPTRLGDGWDNYYLGHFNHDQNTTSNLPAYTSIDYGTLNLPVVLDTYYHTIKSDGRRILVILKH